MSTQIQAPRKTYSSITQLILCCVVFAAVMGWLLTITQGLPVGDPDDWDHILASEDTSWQVFGRNFFVPWSTARNWVAQTDFVDQTIGRRLFHGIALKFVATYFGYQFLPYYFFTKNLFFSATVVILFLLLLDLTKSLLVSILGALFFILVPAYYAHALWLSVPETMVHSYVIAAILIFARLARQMDHQDRSRSFWFWLAGLFVVGWFAMKTKETSVILPLTLGAFLTTRLWRWKPQGASLVSLLLVVGFFFFLMIPVEHLSLDDSLGRVFNWETVKRMTYRNYACGYEDEQTSAFFSRGHVWPVSIARTLGFYLLWTLVILIIARLAQTFFFKYKPASPFFNDPIVGLSVFWMLGEVFLMGFSQPDPRYFSGTMIPITILAARLINSALAESSPGLKHILAVWILFAVGWTCFHNFQHVTRLRLQIGQRSHRFLEVARSIYRDQFPRQEFTMRDLALYYCPVYVPPPASRPRLKNVTYYVELGYGQWNKTADGSLVDYERFAKEGAIYYVTDRPDALLGYTRAVLIQMLAGINQESVFERILYKLKRKQPRPYYIFKHV